MASRPIPISSLDLRMDGGTISVAVGLRLGSTLCRLHTCQHCGAEVDHLATHGLSYRKSEGRHYRHAAIIEIMYRALASACIPSRPESSGLDRSDGKRTDGVTMIPWKNGKPLANMGCNLPRRSCPVLPLLCHQLHWRRGR